MKINIWIILIATAVPMVLGMIWYNPKIGFGKAWMKATDMTEEKAKSSNMALIFSLATLFAFIVAFAMQSLVIHQSHVHGLLSMQPDSGDPDSMSASLLNQVMEHYGDSFRTFRHGLLHGTFAGIMLALPIIGTNALFEAKGFRYIAINAGYWIISMGLMGGIICAYS